MREYKETWLSSELLGAQIYKSVSCSEIRVQAHAPIIRYRRSAPVPDNRRMRLYRSNHLYNIHWKNYEIRL